MIVDNRLIVLLTNLQPRTVCLVLVENIYLVREAWTIFIVDCAADVHGFLGAFTVTDSFNLQSRSDVHSVRREVIPDNPESLMTKLAYALETPKPRSPQEILVPSW